MYLRMPTMANKGLIGINGVHQAPNRPWPVGTCLGDLGTNFGSLGTNLGIYGLILGIQRLTMVI